MSEPIGWKVYTMHRALDGEESYSFVKFVPNEPALATEAARTADEAERYLADDAL